MHYLRCWFIVIAILTLTSCSSTQTTHATMTKHIFVDSVGVSSAGDTESSLTAMNGQGQQQWQKSHVGLFYAHVWGNVNDILLISDFGENRNILFGMSAKDGRVLWQTPVTVGVINLHINGNVAYFIDGSETSSNALIALVITSGKILWQQSQMDYPGELQIGINNLYFAKDIRATPSPACPTVTSMIEAVRLSDGHTIWQHFLPVGAEHLILDGNKLYYDTFASDCNNLNTVKAEFTALNADTGALGWNQSLNTRPGQLQVANGKIFFRSADAGLAQSIFALDSSDGHLLWRYNYSGFLSLLTIDTGIIYANYELNSVPASPQVIALDENSGQVLWKAQLPGSLIFNITEQNDFGPPILANGRLFDISLIASTKVGETPTGRLVALQSKTGARLWQTNTSMSYLTQNISLAWLQGTIYMAYNVEHDSGAQTTQGVIQTIAEVDGHVLWHQTIAHSLSIELVVA